MTIAKSLEQTILKLPLTKREALRDFISKSIEAGHKEMAAASGAADRSMIEKPLLPFDEIIYDWLNEPQSS